MKLCIEIANSWHGRFYCDVKSYSLARRIPNIEPTPFTSEFAVVIK